MQRALLSSEMADIVENSPILVVVIYLNFRRFLGIQQIELKVQKVSVYFVIYLFRLYLHTTLLLLWLKM